MGFLDCQTKALWWMLAFVTTEPVFFFHHPHEQATAATSLFEVISHRPPTFRIVEERWRWPQGLPHTNGVTFRLNHSFIGSARQVVRADMCKKCLETRRHRCIRWLWTLNIRRFWRAFTKDWGERDGNRRLARAFHSSATPCIGVSREVSRVLRGKTARASTFHFILGSKAYRRGPLRYFITFCHARVRNSFFLAVSLFSPIPVSSMARAFISSSFHWTRETSEENWMAHHKTFESWI